MVSRCRHLGLAAGVAVTALACTATPSAAAPATNAGARHTSAVHHPSASETLFTEPADKYQSVYDFITSPKKSLDMTMYALQDTKVEQDLATDASKGVKVRVLLDQNLEKSKNQSAYDYLQKHGVSVAWAPKNYAATHQKTITVDGSRSMILTANLQSQYYSTGREFGVVDTDSADVQAIESVFNADFGGKSVTPGDGDDLTWSPTDSQSHIESVITSAKKSLSIENEEMGDSTIVNDLVAAAKRGVDVKVTMTNTDNEYASEFDTLTKAGVHVSTYSPNASLYIHAKVIIADYGQSSAKVFIGSQNFSDNSLNKNRELGLTSTDSTVLGSVNSTLNSDYSSGTKWSS